MFMSLCQLNLRSGGVYKDRHAQGRVTTATAKSPFTKWLIWTLLSLCLSHIHTLIRSLTPGNGPIFSVAYMVKTLVCVVFKKNEALTGVCVR